VQPHPARLRIRSGCPRGEESARKETEARTNKSKARFLGLGGFTPQVGAHLAPPQPPNHPSPPSLPLQNHPLSKPEANVCSHTQTFHSAYRYTSRTQNKRYECFICLIQGISIHIRVVYGVSVSLAVSVSVSVSVAEWSEGGRLMSLVCKRLAERTRTQTCTGARAQGRISWRPNPNVVAIAKALQKQGTGYREQEQSKNKSLRSWKLET